MRAGRISRIPITSQVSIGTIVTVRDTASGEEETYTMLGAWDGDPEQRIISYQTAIGQALLGRKVGETVTLNTDQGTGDYEIVRSKRAVEYATGKFLAEIGARCCHRGSAVGSFGFG